MSKEDFAQQYDLFTGELVDTRSRKQKQQAEVRQEPQQMEMFSQREMAQFGVDAHPRIPLSPHTRLELQVVDPRTPEEKARDEQRDIERRTYPLPGIRTALIEQNAEGEEFCMARSERDPSSHHDPSLVFWELPEEGVQIHFRLNTLEMEQASPQVREQLEVCLSRLAMLCDLLMANETTLEQRGYSLVDSYAFLAVMLKDTTSFFQMLMGELKPTSASSDRTE